MEARTYTYAELVEKLKAGELSPEEFERLADELSERAASSSAQSTRQESVVEQRIKRAARKARAL